MVEKLDIATAQGWKKIVGANLTDHCTEAEARLGLGKIFTAAKLLGIFELLHFLPVKIL